MNTNTGLGNTARAAGKLFFALALLVVAVAAGFGGTALLVYHRLDGGRAPVARNLADRTTANSSQPKAPNAKKGESEVRPVAALPSDQSLYTYADNSGGQPSMGARRPRNISNVPAPLENTALIPEASRQATSLNDPESHYIVDSRTGRVIGIDGSAGARREEEEERLRLQSAPRAVAVQTPTPEVRVASAVVEDGQSVFQDGQKLAPVGAGTQYLPVRRALPVIADSNIENASRFNVAEYMAGGQSITAPRAQPVGARTTRVYRLSDGSQSVSAN